MVINADRIAELLRLCEAATPGPWSVIMHGENEDGPSYGTTIIDKSQTTADFYIPNSQFIAAARTALPEALDEVVRLRGVLEMIANYGSVTEHAVTCKCAAATARASLKGE